MPLYVPHGTLSPVPQSRHKEGVEDKLRSCMQTFSCKRITGLSVSHFPSQKASMQVSLGLDPREACVVGSQKLPLAPGVDVIMGRHLVAFYSGLGA